MDLESIIWVLIFLIYIASILLKRIRRTVKTRKPAPIARIDADQAEDPVTIDSEARDMSAPKKPSRWQRTLARFQNQIQNKFGDVINQIQQEIAAAREKDSKKETGWEKFLPAKDDATKTLAKTATMTEASSTTAMQESKKAVTSQDAAPLEQKVADQRTAQPLRTASLLKPRPHAKKMVAEETEPFTFPKEASTEGLAYSFQDLKRAIIWSEILAPPLALRNHR